MFPPALRDKLNGQNYDTREDVIDIMGIGLVELTVVLMIGGLLIAVPIGAALLVLYLVRQQNSGRVADLETENRMLRQRLGDSE